MRRRLEGLIDYDGGRWEVGSVGTADLQAEVDRATIRAAAAVGLDISGHSRRRLDRDLLRTEHPDLILTMTRAHLRMLVEIDPELWPRTFSLKELARRTREQPAAQSTSVADWLRDVHVGRRAADMISPDGDDDVADPYGGPGHGYHAMVDDVTRAVDDIVAFGPWATEAGLSPELRP